MSSTAGTAIAHKRMSGLAAILAGGGVGGTLDILYAFIYYWFRNDLPPLTILQSISSGLYGEAAYAGGVPMAALGLFLHYFIACGAAAVYYAASAKIAFLVRRPLLGAIVFGLGMWAVMTLVILPLSAFPHPTGLPKTVAAAISGFFTHCILIGVPVAFFTRRARLG